MSRSHKKNPIVGNTLAKSEANDKKIWHSSLRSQEKININISIREGYEDHQGVHFREVSNIWGFAKDGKHYLSKKNQKNYKYLMK